MVLTVPPTPRPSASQTRPFHRATPLAACPPAVENAPPAYSAGPEPSSNTARQRTPSPTGGAGIPLPKGDQWVPSHFATLFARAEPAEQKTPAAYTAGPAPFPQTPSAGPLPSSKLASARTVAPTPIPSAPQLEPSQVAMLFAGSPPTRVNKPPAQRRERPPSSTCRRAATYSIPKPGESSPPSSGRHR